MEEELAPVLVQPFGKFASVLSDRGIHIWVDGDTRERNRGSNGRQHFSSYSEMLKEIRPSDIEEC